MQTRLHFRSLVVGVLVTLAAGTFVFSLLPHSVAVTAFEAPGVPLAHLLGPFIPTRIIYVLVPDGGAPAFLLLVLVFAFGFWSVCVAAAYLLLRRLRQPRPTA